MHYMVHFRFNFRNTALFVFLFFIVLKFSNLANHKDSEEKVSGKVTLSRAGYCRLFSVGQVACSCSADFFFLFPWKKGCSIRADTG